VSDSPGPGEDARWYRKVEEAAVIGVKDVEWGQQVRAVLRLKKGEKTTEQEIIDFCRPAWQASSVPPQ